MAGLVYANGSPITAKDIGRARLKASLEPGPGGAANAYPYDSASPISPSSANWLPVLRSPDSEINLDRDRLSARARDLVRNDGWAKGAISRILDSAVGSHFFPVPKPNFKSLARRFGAGFDNVWASEFADAIRAEWVDYAVEPRFWADATCVQTVPQMYRTALRGKLVDGDGLACVVWDPDRKEEGARYATCLQLISADRLSNPFRVIDSSTRRGGVEINRAGRVLGYHIQRGHDYDWYNVLDSVTWDYWDRFTQDGRPQIIHAFDRDQDGQHRGVGILAEALTRFRMMNRHDEGSLKASLIRTLIAFFMTSESDPEEALRDLDAGGASDQPAGSAKLGNMLEYFAKNPVNFVNGVRVPVLPPTSKVQSINAPGHVDDYKQMQQMGHRYIAATTGQATPEISNDFSELNYSSFRGESAQAWRTLIRRRVDFANQLPAQHYGAWVEEVVDMFPELLPRGYTTDDFPEMRAALTQAKWIGPGRGWIDPVKERQGEVLGLDAAFGTLEDSCAEIEGEWWLDRIEQREIEVKAMTSRGLKLPDWAAGGVAQDDSKKPQAG
jgi:lambda family phage portal protein